MQQGLSFQLACLRFQLWYLEGLHLGSRLSGAGKPFRQILGAFFLTDGPMLVAHQNEVALLLFHNAVKPASTDTDLNHREAQQSSLDSRKLAV